MSAVPNLSDRGDVLRKKDDPHKDDRGNDGLEPDHDGRSKDGIDAPEREGGHGDVEDESDDVGTDDEPELLAVGHGVVRLGVCFILHGIMLTASWSEVNRLL